MYLSAHIDLDIYLRLTGVHKLRFLIHYRVRTGGSSCRSLLLLLLLSQLLLKLLLCQSCSHARGVGHSWRLIRNFVCDLDILPALLSEYFCELIDVSGSVGQSAKFKPSVTSSLLLITLHTSCQHYLQVLPFLSFSL